MQQCKGVLLSLASVLPTLIAMTPILAPWPVGHGTDLPGFITSIDTMKESMDTDRYPLTNAQIADDVNLAATLNSKYITVDTYWDYPSYMQQWVDAVRAAGRHVWFRIHPNQWEDSNGTTGIMTPAQYESAEQSFILTHPSLFQPGDILDPCPEPENGKYWVATYGSNWSWQGAPNAATNDFNSSILATTAIADNALHQLGIYGVITTIRSVNSWFGTHTSSLYQSTVTQLGHITIDSYPEGTTTDPATAAYLRTSELNNIEGIRGVPIVIGEMGYSNDVNVDDATQEAVLKAEFNSLQTLNYLAGVNYWVGAGTSNSGGYTHIFGGTTSNWTLRPSAYDLSAFYAATLQKATTTQTPLDTNTPIAMVTPVPPTSTATATPAPPTTTATSVPATRTPPGLCPSAWSCGDIGNPALAGSQALSSGTWTVQGAGGDIWGTADQFHYVWQALRGDGSISARVISQTNTDPWAKAEVMLRQSTDPGAPFYDAMVTPGNGITVQYRATAGGSAVQAASIPKTEPVYLKVARLGNTYTAYTSSDGSTWTAVAGSSVTISMSSTVLAGLAVTSHNSGALSTATFDTVSMM